MADEPTGSAGGTPAPDPAGDPPAGDPPAPDPAPKTPEEWAAEHSRMQAAVKAANKEAEKNRLALKQIEDAGKTESQKAADRAAEAEARATRAETELLRFRIATTAGLPPELAARLQGATEAEMLEDAKALLKLVGPSRAGALNGGRQGGPPPEAADMNAQIRRAAGRQT